MTMLLLLLLLLLIAGTCCLAINTRQVICPNDSSKVGYISISDLNNDIAEEFQSFNGDAFLQKSTGYSYNLCPHAILDAQSHRLLPLLNNSKFKCAGHNCTIHGGQVQVDLVDYPTSNVQYLSFTGISFSASTKHSIAAFGGRGKVVDFFNCHWENGLGTSDIQIALETHDYVEETAPEGGNVTSLHPFLPDLKPLEEQDEAQMASIDFAEEFEEEEGLVEDSVDGVVDEKDETMVLHPFLPDLKPMEDADEAQMASIDLEEEDFTLIDEDNNGVADIFDLNRRKLSSFSGAMTVRIYDSTFTNTNTDRYSAIFNNAGQLLLSNVTVQNFQRAGVIINTVGGQATIERSHFELLEGISIIRALNSTSGVTVKDSTFVANDATGIITAIGSDDVVISKCVFYNNFCQAAPVLVFWSNVDVQDSCIMVGGSTSNNYGAIYSSATSRTTATNVYYDNGGADGERCAGMFSEAAGSTCFDEGGTCTGRCDDKLLTAQTCPLPYYSFGSSSSSATSSRRRVMLPGVTAMLVAAAAMLWS